MCVWGGGLFLGGGGVLLAVGFWRATRLFCTLMDHGSRCVLKRSCIAGYTNSRYSAENMGVMLAFRS